MTPEEARALGERVGFAVSEDDRAALEELAAGIERWQLNFGNAIQARDEARLLGERRVQVAIDLLVRMQRAVADTTLPPCSHPDCKDFASGWVPLCHPHIVEVVEGPSGPARTWSALGIAPARASRG